MSGSSAAKSAASGAATFELTFRALVSRYEESSYDLRVLDLSGRDDDAHVRALYQNIFGDLQQLQPEKKWGDRLVVNKTNLNPKTDVKCSVDSASQTFFVGVQETNQGVDGGTLIECGLFTRGDLDGKCLLSVLGALTTVDRAELETVDMSKLT